jgi:hypothetical protein
MTIDGDVVAVHSYWVGDHAEIVTDATVRTADGRDVVVNQFGGTVDGIGMIQMPGQPILQLGMRVAIAAHTDFDLRQTEHVVLDSVKILAYPEGFVRTGPTQSGHYLKWESGCVFVKVDEAGTAAIPGDLEFSVIDKAIATWNDDTASCSYLQVMDEGRTSLEVKNDKINIIKFRDTGCLPCGGAWCRPAIDNTPMHCNSMDAAGITTAVYVDDPKSDRDGAILDADIELNAANFAIAVDGQTTSSQPCIAELQNTLTHELGHLHGLEHPCKVPGDPDRIDDQNQPVPSCFAGGLPAKITQATMYNFQSCGEKIKETLSDDDINAICKIYPIASDPGTCDHVGKTSSTGGCCSASHDRPDATLLLGATVLLAMRRRKNSRSA